MVSEDDLRGGVLPCIPLDELRKLIIERIKFDYEGDFVVFMRDLLRYQRFEENPLSQRIKWGDGNNAYTKEFSNEILKTICLHRAIKCATCLLEKDSRLCVDDLNVVVVEEEGLTPLHLAARTHCYELTKLFLLYGAEPNLSCNNDQHKGMVPLGFALEALSNHQLVTDNWSLGDSLYTLIFLFHLKEMVEPFDVISLLAARTTREHLESIGLGYAKEGEVVKLTALLLVAWDTLVSPYAKGNYKCCPIMQCLGKELSPSLLDEQEMMNASRQWCSHNHSHSHRGYLLDDDVRKSKLLASWKMLNILLDRYDGLNEYRHGVVGPCFKKKPEGTFNHVVPRAVTRSMGIYNFIESLGDEVLGDRECFKPGLPPKEKALFDQVLQDQMRSGPATLYVPPVPDKNNGFVASFCSLRPFHTSASPNQRMEFGDHLVAAKGSPSDDDNVDSSSDHDDDDEEEEEEDDYPDIFESIPDYTQRVVVNSVANRSKDEAICVLQSLSPKFKAAVQPILDCLIDNRDKEACLRAIAHCLSDDNGTALHYAADHSSYVLIAALLDNGEDPNIRRDWNDNLKQALPLNVALDFIARQVSGSLLKVEKTHGKLSAFKLVCEMSSTDNRSPLECVRLLALRTKELNDEIFKYTMEGKVIELCALMFLGYDTRVPTRASIKLDDSTKEEQVLQLIETFARIGDKLRAYVTLNSSPFGARLRGLVSEIASMFKDAGLPLCNKENLIYTDRYNADVCKNPTLRFPSPEFLAKPMSGLQSSEAEKIALHLLEELDLLKDPLPRNLYGVIFLKFLADNDRAFELLFSITVMLYHDHKSDDKATTIEDEEDSYDPLHPRLLFILAGIAFNAATCPSFGSMIEAIGRYGPRMKPPSMHEIRVPLLKNEVEDTKKQMEDHEKEWAQKGCSLLSDGWRDSVVQKDIVNFLVNSPKGSVFIKSMNVSEIVKNDLLFKMLDDMVEEFGEPNVVQVVTNKASNYVKAGKLLEAKRQHLFWTPYAAHCIDLMLEDIGKIPQVSACS